MKCSGCRCAETFYCSRECQVKDYATHKYDCKEAGASALSVALSSLPPSQKEFDVDDYFLLRKTYFKLCKMSKTKVKGVPPLSASLENLAQGATNSDDTLTCFAVVVSILGERPSHANLDSLARHSLTAFFVTLLSKFRSNNFGIASPLQVVIGAGIYEEGAVLNHSCSPNCVLIYAQTRNALMEQHIVVIKDVEEGEELCHSYVELAQTTKNRRDHLNFTYGFTCRCVRCAGEKGGELDKLFEGVQEPIPESVRREIEARIERAEAAMYSDEPDDPVLEYSLVAKSLEQQRKYLHPLNLQLYKNEGLALGLAMLSGDTGKSIEHCEKLVYFLRNVLPSYHPLLALQVMTLAELYQGCANYQSAKKAHGEALGKFQVLYGHCSPDHDFLLRSKENLKACNQAISQEVARTL